MDPVILFTIIIIIAAILVLDFYKQQQNRITSNMHNDNLKQFLTLSALEYKFNDYQSGNEKDGHAIADQITQLVDSYEKGEIPVEAFSNQMDYLLHQLN